MEFTDETGIFAFVLILYILDYIRNSFNKALIN